MQVLWYVNRIFEQRDTTLPNSIKNAQARLYEELAEALANSGDIVGALDYQMRFIQKIENQSKPTIPQQQHSQAYRALTKRLLSIGKYNLAKENFKKSLELYIKMSKKYPYDIRLQLALAGINAEIALMYHT